MPTTRRSFVLGILLFALVAPGCHGGMNEPDAGVSADMAAALDAAMPAWTDLATEDLRPRDMAMPDLAGCAFSHFCPSPKACPCQEPVNATACGTKMYECFYEMCAYSCTCFAPDSTWHCCSIDPPPSCPLAQLTDGDFCCLIDQRCSNSCSAGVAASCACGADHRWTCTQSACGG